MPMDAARGADTRLRVSRGFLISRAHPAVSLLVSWVECVSLIVTLPIGSRSRDICGPRVPIEWLSGLRDLL